MNHYPACDQVLAEKSDCARLPRKLTSANQHTHCGCMTIQAALVGGKESQRVREELIDLRLRGQEALRQRFERAQEENDLAKTADASDLARFVTAIFQGMTVQAINGASLEELLRLAQTALGAWPK
jgi:hypothetical protein